MLIYWNCLINHSYINKGALHLSMDKFSQWSRSLERNPCCFAMVNRDIRNIEMWLYSLLIAKKRPSWCSNTYQFFKVIQVINAFKYHGTMLFKMSDNILWNMMAFFSVPNYCQSVSPKQTTLEEDWELFKNFSSILFLQFEIQHNRTDNFVDWVLNTAFLLFYIWPFLWP